MIGVRQRSKDTPADAAPASVNSAKCYTGSRHAHFDLDRGIQSRTPFVFSNAYWAAQRFRRQWLGKPSCHDKDAADEFKCWILLACLCGKFSVYSFITTTLHMRKMGVASFSPQLCCLRMIILNKEHSTGVLNSCEVLILSDGQWGFCKEESSKRAK